MRCRCVFCGVGTFPMDPLSIFTLNSLEAHGFIVIQASEDAIRAAFAQDRPPNLVVAVHAVRAGKFFAALPDFVPAVLLLSGTDVSQYMNPGDGKPEIHALLKRVLQRTTATVAFTAAMRATFLSYVARVHPDLEVPKCTVIPQAVCVSGSCPGDEDEGLTPAGDSVREHLALPSDAYVFLQPAGIRHVKDPAFLVKEFVAWHALQPRVHYVVIGPWLDADAVSEFTAAVAAASGTRCSHSLQCGLSWIAFTWMPCRRQSARR